MKFSGTEKIIKIMERALNLVDPRLIGHGKSVAYRLFKSLHPLGMYDDEKLRDICILGLLHDIGAYKTDDINDILDFDAENTWAHPVYGYLFLKHFSPIKSLAPAVLFHHANPICVPALDHELKNITQLLKISDRSDIHRYHISGANLDQADMDADTEFNRIFEDTPLTDEAAEAYMHMLAFAIDFRSPQTMLHTFAAAHTAQAIAQLAHVDKNQIKRLKTAAMLHDIGKMGIPLHILEGTASELSAYDMEIMRTHVVLSEKVLMGLVDEDILNMAVNHHERLNGKGYPKGLNASNLSYLDQLMATADIFSALCVSRNYQKALPKEKAVKVLDSVRNQNLLDPGIIELAIRHYDEISASLDIKSKAVAVSYASINEELRRIHDKIDRGQFDLLEGSCL